MWQQIYMSRATGILVGLRRGRRLPPDQKQNYKYGKRDLRVIRLNQFVNVAVTDNYIKYGNLLFTWHSHRFLAITATYLRDRGLNWSGNVWKFILFITWVNVKILNIWYFLIYWSHNLKRFLATSAALLCSITPIFDVVLTISTVFNLQKNEIL